MAMADPEKEDLYRLHSAIEEKREGEIQEIKEKYKCILGSFEVEGKRGEFKGLSDCPCFPRV